MQYKFVEPETLAHTAQVMGEASAAWGALADLVRRGEKGEIPICVQASLPNQRSGTYLVFDMRNPPDKLPQVWQDECRKRAAEIDAAEEMAGKPDSDQRTEAE